MIKTESEMMEMPCPFMSGPVCVIDAANGGATVDHYEVKCNGSECPAWRWREGDGRGYCGAGGEP